MLEMILATLKNFAENPNESWGEPTDGWGNPTDISIGKEARVTVEQGDRNTARICSGTYTEEQYADFEQQLARVEQTGGGTAVFPGDPGSLPSSLCVLECPKCHNAFWTSYEVIGTLCYTCNLDKLCPVLPGRHITARWKRDEWSMEAHGDIGFKNEIEFRWYNQNGNGNVCHQGLTVRRSEDGKIRTLIFSTIAFGTSKCYTVTHEFANFDKAPYKAASTKFAVRDSISVSFDEYEYRYKKVLNDKPFDDLVICLMRAMMPQWMLFKHRPRNPANGCFA